MVSSVTLGKAIQTARKEAGLTQDELSDRAGLAYSTLAKIEQGAIKSPSFFTIQSLAHALEMTLSEMLGEDTVRDDESTTTNSGTSKTIKFIYTDMNGVLLRHYHRAFSTVARETQCGLDQVQVAMWHLDDRMNKGEMTTEDFNRAMAESLGVDHVDWKRHYMNAVKPIKEMHQLLKDLSPRYKIGMMTNTAPGYVKELGELGLLPDVKLDAIIDSSEVGMLKPDPKMYELAEKEAGFKGDEILFIDDSRINLTAADKFDWRIVWFDTFDPEDSVRKLRELLDD